MIELTYISISQSEILGKQRRLRGMDLVRQVSDKAVGRYIHDINTKLETGVALEMSWFAALMFWTTFILLLSNAYRYICIKLGTTEKVRAP